MGRRWEEQDSEGGTRESVELGRRGKELLHQWQTDSHLMEASITSEFLRVYWEDRLAKMAAARLNIVETWVVEFGMGSMGRTKQQYCLRQTCQKPSVAGVYGAPPQLKLMNLVRCLFCI